MSVLRVMGCFWLYGTQQLLLLLLSMLRAATLDAVFFVPACAGGDRWQHRGCFGRVAAAVVYVACSCLGCRVLRAFTCWR